MMVDLTGFRYRVLRGVRYRCAKLVKAAKSIRG
jgi:hypothetical protein